MNTILRYAARVETITAFATATAFAWFAMLCDGWAANAARRLEALS